MPPDPPNSVRPRTAFLLRSLEMGGAERQAALAAAGLAKRGWPVTFLVFYAGGPLTGLLEEAGVRVVDLAKGGRWDLPGFRRRLIRALARENPQVLYSFLDAGNLAAALVKDAVPGLRLAWGVRASYMDLSRYDLFSRLVFRAALLLSRRADRIIFNSRAGLEHHLKLGYPPGGARVVENGIDTRLFRPDPLSRARRRADWGVGDDERLVGLVGRLDPMKDHAAFLKAASLAMKADSGLRFVCVGGGDKALEEELARLGRELGLGDRLVWAGARRNMPPVYNALDLLASTSRGEGFPNVVGEAMACGVIPVVTDVGDSARLVGDNRLVAPPGRPEETALKWLEVLSLPRAQREEMAETLRRRVEENFSLEAMVEKTARILEDLAAMGGG